MEGTVGSLPLPNFTHNIVTQKPRNTTTHVDNSRHVQHWGGRGAEYHKHYFRKFTKNHSQLKTSHVQILRFTASFCWNFTVTYNKFFVSIP